MTYFKSASNKLLIQTIQLKIFDGFNDLQFLLLKAAGRMLLKGYFYNLDPDPEKPGINIGLKNMYDFR